MILGINKVYKFSQLEKFLRKSDGNKCLLVKNVDQNITAIMHVFAGNFCGDWLSGDGVLFYNDGEVHSAEPDDEFELINIIKL
jgi:hypothetical protein